MSEYFYPDHVRQDILRMIPPDGKVIGSIGCGSAANEFELQKLGREMHGVDVHAPAIEIAKTRLSSARVVAPDEKQLFAHESLDGLILADVIEHIPFAWERLKEFATYVKPGGWVVISVPNMRNIWIIREFFLGGDWPENEMGLFDRTHIQVMSPKRLVRWCTAAGLSMEEWFPHPPTTHTLIIRFLRAMNLLTFKRFDSWMQYQLQVRCRRRK